MPVTISGFDELKRKLERLGDMQGKVSLTELMPTEFMRSFTRFQTIEEMFADTPFKADAESLRLPGSAEVNAHVAANTSFPSWAAMVSKAGNEHVKRKLAGG